MYTRLFSKAKVISNWEDEEASFEEMDILFHDSESQGILEKIEVLKEASTML